MSAYKLSIATSPYKCDSSVGVRVRIQCTSSTGLSSKIFAYTLKGKFSHVCNTVDMIECPEDTPSTGSWPAWYRTNVVDLLVPNVESAYDFIQKVKEDVTDLYNAMKQYNTLISETSYIVGNEADLAGDDDGDDSTT